MAKKTPESKPQYFRTQAAFAKWLEKNNSKKTQVWVLLYKKDFIPLSSRNPLTYFQAWDTGLCHGWVETLTRRIDQATYKMKFAKRKSGSVWSDRKVSRFKALKKEGQVFPSGEKAFLQRDKIKSQPQPSTFTKAQLAEFKRNPKAWDYFQAQPPGYQRHMKSWVTTAKRAETKGNRLAELISDSSEGSKLKRILKAIEKTKPKYPPGRTPIEAARNIGPTTGADLRASGIDTLENLEKIGWEEAFLKLCELHPHRLNLNMLYALVGAVENQSSRKLDPELKSEAKMTLRQIRREWDDF